MNNYTQVVNSILEVFRLNTVINGNNNIIITSIIMAFLTYISNVITNYSFKRMNINLFIDNLKGYFLKYNTIVIEGKRCVKNGPHSVRVDNLFGETFLALWKYINDNLYNKSDIYTIKELSEGIGLYDDWGDTNTSSEKNRLKPSVYVVKQHTKFRLEDDIYCMVFFENEEMENNNSKIISKNENIIIKLYSHKRTLFELKNYVNNITERYLESLDNSRWNKLFIYNYEGASDTDFRGIGRRSANVEWSEHEFTSSRSFDNIFFDGKVELIKKLNFFIQNKDWYYKEGHPYTLGIGLSGPPGTGKTSIIKSVANKLRRHLVVIPLSKIKTTQELSKCFFENQYNVKNKEGSINFDNKIIVFEDIDCMSDIVCERENIKKDKPLEKKENSEESLNTKEIISAVVKGMREDDLEVLERTATKQEDDKLTLSYILNIIDGIRETPGRIMILTSNFYNRLDKALIRPGRVDITLELKNASIKTIEDFYYNYYNERIPDNTLLKLKNDVISPAELVNIRLNSTSADEYLNNLIERLG